MIIQELLNALDGIVKNNSFLSVVLIGLIVAFTYDVVKKLIRFLLFASIKTIKKTPNRISKKKLENAKILLEHYNQELESVKQLKNNSKSIIVKLIGDLYENLIWVLFIVLGLLLIDKFGTDITFYGFLGACSTLGIRVSYQLYFNSQLFEKVKKFDKYEIKIMKRIHIIEEIIDNATNSR